MQSPVYGFPSGNAFSYGRGMSLPFYQPYYQNSYFSPTLRSPTRPTFTAAAPPPASPNLQTTLCSSAGSSLPVLCQPDQLLPDSTDNLANQMRNVNI